MGEALARRAAVVVAALVLAGCSGATTGTATPTPTPPDPAAPVQPYVASPEPPATVCTRRGCNVDPDPVRLYFRSCRDVPDELKPLTVGEPGYRTGLDRDRDGKACDQ